MRVRRAAGAECRNLYNVSDKRPVGVGVPDDPPPRRGGKWLPLEGKLARSD